MPKYGPYLPDIEKKVHDKISELEFDPKYIFDTNIHQERFYTAPCRDKKGDKVVFKMRTEDYQETKASFRREIKINQLFTKFYKRSNKLSVPKFVKGDSEHVPEWMVYEFIEGYEAGDFYNGLEKGNIGKFPLEDLISGIKNMQKMSAFAQGEINLKTQKYIDFKKAYEKYRGNLSPFFAQEEIEKGGEILQSGKKLLDEKSGIITHGDFHPGNLIITPGEKAAIIDWYYVHLNNMAFDIAFFYLEISDREFQKQVLGKFFEKMKVDKTEFWHLFRLDILRLVPQKINVFYDALGILEPKKEDYYVNLTPKGVAKLETNLEAFRKALAGEDFM
ncbi:MAG: phosphotransferase [Candidatus Paceibacterota bacterium]